MKRNIALILALVMCLGMVFGCAKPAAPAAAGTDAAPSAPAAEAAAPAPADPNAIDEGSNKSASGETDKDVYIDFWGVWAQDNYRAMYWQEKAAEFCEEYEAETGISVQFEYYGQGSYAALSEKLAAGAVTKELPVISQVEEQATARFYTLGADLTKYLPEDVINNYLDGLMVSCTQRGKICAVPAGRSYIVASVNKTLLEQSGHSVEELADWTWDDMHQISKDIAALGDGVYGQALYWDEDAWPWESSVYSNGGSIDNEDGTKIMFDEASGTPILDLAVEMMLDGSAYSAYNAFDYLDVTDGFYDLWAQGKLGMYIGSITMYKSGLKFRDNYEGHADFDVVVARQPAGTAGFSVVTGGSNMMIMDSATETQKKVAAAFFEYLAEDDNCAGWNETSGYMAFTKSVKDAPAFKETTDADPNLLNIYQFVEDAHARPTTAHWQEMYSTVIIQDLVDLSQHPEKYDTHEKTTALVNGWVEKCQKILDEGN